MKLTSHHIRSIHTSSSIAPNRLASPVLNRYPIDGYMSRSWQAASRYPTLCSLHSFNIDMRSSSLLRSRTSAQFRLQVAGGSVQYYHEPYLFSHGLTRIFNLIAKTGGAGALEFSLSGLDLCITMSNWFINWYILWTTYSASSSPFDCYSETKTAGWPGIPSACDLTGRYHG